MFSGTKDSPVGVISIFDRITNNGHFHNFIFKVRNKRMCTFWNWSTSKPTFMIMSVMHVQALSFDSWSAWVNSYFHRTDKWSILNENEHVTHSSYCNFCSTLERKFYIPTCSWFFTFKLIKVHDYQSRYLSTHTLFVWYQNFQLTKFPFLAWILSD